MRLLLKFLKRKLENGRVKSVSVEHVHSTCRTFLKELYTSYQFLLHLIYNFNVQFIMVFMGE